MNETARSLGGDPQRVDIEQRQQRPKRICLASIVHYYLLMYASKGNNADYITHKQLAARVKMNADHLNALFNKAAGKGVQKLYDHFDGLIHGKNGGQPDPIFADPNLPEHIEVAIRNAYRNGAEQPISVLEEPTGPPAPRVDEFNLAQVRDKDPEILSQIASAYTGVWRVIRYSAHATPGEKSEEDEQGNVVNAFTVLATAQIFPPDPNSPNQDLRFEIHYQPRRQGKGRHLTSKGSVLSLGKGAHLFFSWRRRPRVSDLHHCFKVRALPDSIRRISPA